MADAGPRLCVNCAHCATINSTVAVLTYYECDHPSSVVHPAVNLVTGASLRHSTRRLCSEARGGLYGPECGAAGRFFEAREPRDPSFLEVTGLDPCPSCRASTSDVTDSRAWHGQVKRRRKCRACAHRWSTLEVPFDMTNVREFHVMEAKLRRLAAEATEMADALRGLAELVPTKGEG